MQNHFRAVRESVLLKTLDAEFHEFSRGFKKYDEFDMRSL